LGPFLLSELGPLFHAAHQPSPHQSHEWTTEFWNKNRSDSVVVNDIVATSRFYKITQQPVNITNHCLQSMYSYLSAAHLTEAVVERLLFFLIHFLEFMKQFL